MVPDHFPLALFLAEDAGGADPHIDDLAFGIVVLPFLKANHPVSHLCFSTQEIMQGEKSNGGALHL